MILAYVRIVRVDWLVFMCVCGIRASQQYIYINQKLYFSRTHAIILHVFRLVLEVARRVRDW